MANTSRLAWIRVAAVSGVALTTAAAVAQQVPPGTPAVGDAAASSSASASGAPPTSADAPGVSSSAPAAPQLPAPPPAASQAPAAGPAPAAPPALVPPTQGEAAQPPEPVTVYRRHLGLGFGTATGLGLVAGSIRGRLNYVALEGAAGFAPILLMSSGDSRCTAIAVEIPVQLTGSLIFFFTGDQKRFAPGLRVAAVHNSMLGIGGMLGFESELRINRFLSLGIGAGLKVHPTGGDWAKKRLQEEVGASCRVQNDTLNTVFPYINFQVLLYPI